jgi:hypothetical protein
MILSVMMMLAKTHTTKDQTMNIELTKEQMKILHRALECYQGLWHHDFEMSESRDCEILQDLFVTQTLAKAEPAPEASGDAKLRALREKVCGWAGGSTDPRSADPSDIDAAQLVREIDHLLADHYPELLIEEN